jgi:hypothetical protein
MKFFGWLPNIYFSKDLNSVANKMAKMGEFGEEQF